MIQSKIYFMPAILLFALMAFQCKSKKEAAEGDTQPREAMIALADSVADDGLITTQYAARIQTETPQYTRRHRLMREANEAELISLVAHPSAVVWVTAMEGLYRKNVKSALDTLLPQALDENRQLHYIRGDISMHMPALEYLYSYVMGFSMPGEQLPQKPEPVQQAYSPAADWPEKAASKIDSYRNLR